MVDILFECIWSCDRLRSPLDAQYKAVLVIAAASCTALHTLPYQYVCTCLPAVYALTSDALQALLSVWGVYPTQPVQHMRELHPLASGHHRGATEAGHRALVQGVREISAASKALGEGRPGVQRAAHILHKAAEGTAEGKLLDFLTVCFGCC